MLKMLRKMLSVFDRKQKIKILIMFIMIMLGSICELVGVTAILPFINMLMAPQSYINKPYLRFVYDFFSFTSIEYFIIFMAFCIIIIYLVKNAYLVFLGDVQFRFTYNSQMKLSSRIMKIYMHQPYLFFTGINRSEAVRNVFADPQSFFHVVLAILQLATDSSVCIVLFLFLFITDKTITIFILTIFGVYFALYIKIFKKKMAEFGARSREQNTKLGQCMYQAFGGIKEIKILNKEDFFLKSFNRLYDGYVRNLRKNNLIGNLNKPFMEVLVIGGLLVAISIKIYKGVDMNYFIPVLTSFAVAAFKVMPSFSKILSNIGTIIFCKPSVDAIFCELERVKQMENTPLPDGSGTDEVEFVKEIRMEGLYFHYPAGESLILDNVNMIIPKNKSVAFIGPSGAGKTTLADILLGVLTPTNGYVYVDGIDVHQNLYAWHRKLGYIPQNIYLADDSIRNNIAFGYDINEIDDECVWKALEAAQLKGYVESLSEGLDTVIGEGGVKLSGGQRQRIGIARALYSNPEILVLDEATSALDNETEQAVMEAIESLAGTKTLIIIAHRLATIENCDLKYEIKNGKATLV